MATVLAFLSVVVGGQSLNAADSTLGVTVVPNKNIGVSFGWLPVDETEVTVLLNPPAEWQIVTNDSSTTAVDHSGVTIWHKEKATDSQHIWKGYGVSREAPQGIIASGTYVRFEGELKTSGTEPGDPPSFKVSVADININVDSGIPPRHYGTHWEPWANDASAAGRIEDMAESGGPGSGMYLPAGILPGEGVLPQSVNLNALAWKILRVRIRTAWGGNPDQESLSNAGTLSFEFDGAGFALYDGQGNKITNGTSIVVPAEGFSGGVDYAIVTNESFTSPGGITAKFLWGDPPRAAPRYEAFDDVRLVPSGAHLEVDLAVDSDNDGLIGQRDEEDWIEEYAPGVIIRLDRKDLASDADELKMCHLSPRTGLGTLKLEAIEGAGRIKAWLDASKTVPLPNWPEQAMVWQLSDAPLPSPLFLDGVALGSGKLKLTHTQGEVSKSDIVAFHVTQTTSWSPRRNTLVTWEPEPSLGHHPCNAVVNETCKDTLDNKQGFLSTRHWANPPPNSDVRSCTFQALKEACNSGIVSVHSHGSLGFFVGIRRATKAEVEQWLNIAPGGEPPQGISIGSSLLDGGTWIARVELRWLRNNWEAMRTGNHAIGFFFGCHSAEKYPSGPWQGESVCTVAGGRVNFGYETGTEYYDDSLDANTLLQRMNGKADQTRLRTAGQAFAAGGFQGSFQMQAGNQATAPWTTLCAAPYCEQPAGGTHGEFPRQGQALFQYPSEHEHAGSQLGFACILFDSYVDTQIAPTEALIVQGQCDVFGQYWFGKHACGVLFRRPESETVTVSAHAAKCRNEADADHTRAMDADRCAPNDEDAFHMWSF
jgi:hypothetical protein